MKKQVKKLRLNVETVRHLAEPELAEAEGAASAFTQCPEASCPCQTGQPSCLYRCP